MSLQKLAKHLETAGRNNDSMLVHMSPREVSGLQALARQHGGDLTINPNTGLVEAGFLESVLPTIAGLGLSLIPGVGPLAAAALVGGGTTVATGSLEKGLMAGLGAYGGAGIGSSLSSAGTAAVPEAVSTGSTTINAIPNATAGAGPAIPAGATEVSKLNAIAANPAGMTPDVMTGRVVDAVETTSPSFTSQIGSNFDAMKTGFGNATDSFKAAGDFASQNKGNLLASAAPIAYSMANPNSSLFGKDEIKTPEKTKSTQRPYSFSTEQNPEAYANTGTTAEQVYFDENRFTALPTYQAKEGGLMAYATGGPVENMSAQNAVGNNSMYPQSQLQTPMYSNPMVQRPMPTNVISSGIDAPTNPYTGEARMAEGGLANYNGYSSGGGLKSYADGGYNLGSYSDGGRLLKGPGDGVSDSIPASIGDRQPARLADGEFVVPARIVSELGNGSTDAGARKLYTMMDRVQKQRGKTTGKGKVAVNSKADKYMPA